jgi:zinc protease
VIALAASATYFSLRSKPAPPQETKPVPAATVATVDKPLDPPTTKTDTAAPTAEPRPWPQAASNIPADDSAVYGSLENGLRYIIYPNSEPPTRVSLRLHIAAGSLMEADDQRGLAHFLEHMVFNGSKNYTAAELIPRMQRLGISFGAHANAYTSFDETVYMLDLPDLSKENLDLGFTVMRDFGDGALLQAEV